MDTKGILEFGINYAGFWESNGGGSIKGVFSISEADAADGVASLDELITWDLDWTGNDAVDEFSISSDDGEAIALLPPGGFVLDGPNTPVDADFNDADGLDQGLYQSESGEQLIDLGALIVEDLAADTVTEGDAAAAGSSSVGEILEFNIQYSGFWDGGGSIEGTFSAVDADVEDGIVSIDELLSWDLHWTGNDDVDAFSILSDDGDAIAVLPPGGFLLDGPNTPVDADFNDADGFDQGLYESDSGEQFIDLGALIIEDLSEDDLAQGDATAEGSIFVGKFLDFSLQYSGFWEGGGSVKGTFSATEAAAADGIISLDELISWNLDWTGNDEVDAFSISSDDGEAIALLPPGGFLLSDTNTAIDADLNDPDGLDQGLYESGSGEEAIDLGALIIEDVADSSVAQGNATDGRILVTAGLTETLDFEGDDLESGTVITDQFDGITIATDTEFGAMLFDTDNPTGGDADLASDDLDNVLIISEDGDSSDADDNGDGGVISVAWDSLVGVFSVGLLDIDEPGSTLNFYGDDDSLLETIEIPAMENNGFQTLTLGIDNVARMELDLVGSGALTDIEYAMVADTAVV